MPIPSLSPEIIPLDVDALSKLFSGLVPGSGLEEALVTALDSSEAIAPISREDPVEDILLQVPAIEESPDSGTNRTELDFHASFLMREAVSQLEKQSGFLQALADSESRLNRRKRENDFFLRLRKTLLPINTELTAIKDAIGTISSGSDNSDYDLDNEKKKRRNQGRNSRRNRRNRRSNRGLDLDTDQSRDTRTRNQDRDSSDRRDNQGQDRSRRDPRFEADVDSDSNSNRRSRNAPPVPDLTPDIEVPRHNSALRSFLSSVPKVGAVGTAAMMLPDVIDTAQVLMSDAPTEEKITSARETTVEAGTIAAGAGLGGTIGGSIGAGLGLLFGGVGAVPLGITGNVIGSAVGGWLASESGVADYINDNVGKVLDSTISTVVQGAESVIQSVSTGADELIDTVSTSVGPAWESVKSGFGSFSSSFVGDAKADDVYTGPVVTKTDLMKKETEAKSLSDSESIAPSVTPPLSSTHPNLTPTPVADTEVVSSESAALDTSVSVQTQEPELATKSQNKDSATQLPVTFVPALTRITTDNFVDRFSASQAQTQEPVLPAQEDSQPNIFTVDTEKEKPFNQDSFFPEKPAVVAVAAPPRAPDSEKEETAQVQSTEVVPQLATSNNNSIPTNSDPNPVPAPIVPPAPRNYREWLAQEQKGRDQLEAEILAGGQVGDDLEYQNFNESVPVNRQEPVVPPIVTNKPKTVDKPIEKIVSNAPSSTEHKENKEAEIGLNPNPNPNLNPDPEVVAQDILNETTNPLFGPPASTSAAPVVEPTIKSPAPDSSAVASEPQDNATTTPKSDSNLTPNPKVVQAYSEIISPAPVNEKRKSERVLNEFYPQTQEVELVPTPYDPLDFNSVPKRAELNHDPASSSLPLPGSVPDPEYFIRRIEDSVSPIQDAIVSSIQVEQKNPTIKDSSIKVEQHTDDSYPRLAFDQVSGSDISHLSESFHESIMENRADTPLAASSSYSGGGFIAGSSPSLGFTPAPITFETTPLMVNDLGLLLINSGII